MKRSVSPLILSLVAGVAGFTLLSSPLRAEQMSVMPPSDRAPAAAEPAVKTDAKGRRVSERKAPAAKGMAYFVEFRSRYALSYGHTFMAYGRLTADGKIATQTITGFHPTGDDATWWSIGHVIWVPSEVVPSDGDLEEEYISARYRIDLTQPQYEDVVAFAKKLGRESPMWHAVLYNCSAFVGRIANYMGLQTPSSLDYPADFINGMRRMNNDVRTVTTLGGTPMAQGQSQ